jgi:hypothetical protein
MTDDTLNQTEALAETILSGDQVMATIRQIETAVQDKTKHEVVAACLAIAVAVYRPDLLESEGGIGEAIPHLTTFITTYQPGQVLLAGDSSIPN